jgi:hypothetical protein
MKAKGNVRATPADSPELTLDEAFWESAEDDGIGVRFGDLSFPA